MTNLLKDMYNHESLNKLALDVKSVYNTFPTDEFLQSTMDATWENLELKARVRKISMNLGVYLPTDFKEAVYIIDKIAANYNGFFGIIFPDFVEVYGQDEWNWEVSIEALERYTQYSSSEFAVRPFVINREERMMAQMYEWSKHENEHVRRLSSEGCRPQLPWGQALSKYKKDPAPILPILEQLKTDSSLYVRKSVANNLNDISKTHPDLVVKIAQDWYGKNEKTDWIIKHGCRTLLKKGSREVLEIFGYYADVSVEVTDFTQSSDVVKMGEDISFSFNVLARTETKVRLEYGIDYMKLNGKRNRKIFQISEILLKEGEKRLYEKKHSFTNLTTRKHYPGIHSIVLILNGVEHKKLDFELIN